MGPASQSSTSNQQSIESEVNEYQATPELPIFNDIIHETFNNPLDWWRLRQDKFPRVSKLARKLLAIPATSAPPERVFSSAGNIITDKRSRLMSDLATSLILVRQYYNLDHHH